MNYIDISWPITNNITSWENKFPVKIIHDYTFSKNNQQSSSIHMSLHTGTHIDFPKHFIKNGKTSENYDINDLSGRCKVLELNCDKIIKASDLKRCLIKKNDIILFKTKNSNLGNEDKFNSKFVSLDISVAKYLAEIGVKTVGIDYLGIEDCSKKSGQVHKILLDNDIPIIEGLRLKNVKMGIYKLLCFPLKIIGVEGCPVRAILLK